MTKREMIEAMLDGKVLVDEYGNEAFYDEAYVEPFRFRFVNGSTDPLNGAWGNNWKIKEEPKQVQITTHPNHNRTGCD